MMLTVLLQFLIAHVLGDFVLQPKSLVEKRKLHIKYLLLHVAVHALMLLVIFSQSLNAYWHGIVFILATHLGIDSLKIWYEHKWPTKPFRAFVVDQLLHLLMIGLVTIYYYPDYFQQLVLWSPVNLLYILTFLVLVFVTPIIMRVFFSKWDQEQAFTGKKTDTLLDAGLVIGILERLMVVLFIQLNFLPGIGFLIAAKSIFRFGDLTNAKNTKFTEYILVGTFLSFTIALVLGVLLKLATAKLL
ncbi:DUF3307 domain-containing protein [Sphingobacterium sp. lm-10]|uniref:DUF3307 domain-containing protein n=1 Tax=Sphingobacterium sp. lm-10 TaxID=2944904 RepID=UPI0020224F6C|nr:DUF3307 domain-containing protein [Sphingobacterium sp. lm-10]MCL7987194.1 DUF3307 domain-containing protein [Sphingobacterium sp. lm-10]